MGSSINLGIFSDDNLFPGVNAFTIQNLTGAPSCSNPCVLSDFPILTSASFQDLNFDLLIGATHQTGSLPVLGVGSATPNLLDFSASSQISEIALTGTLDTSLLTLQDGSTVTVDPNSLQALLTPATGNQLQTGDLAIITVDVVTNAAIPEPALGLATMCALGIAIAIRRLKR